MDLYYTIIYLILTVTLLGAAIIGGVWLFGTDSPETRKSVP